MKKGEARRGGGELERRAFHVGTVFLVPTRNEVCDENGVLGGKGIDFAILAVVSE